MTAAVLPGLLENLDDVFSDIVLLKCLIHSEIFSKWFFKAENAQAMTTRSRKMSFKPVPARTKAFTNSPIPQMVALANKLGLPEARSLKLNSGNIIIL